MGLLFSLSSISITLAEMFVTSTCVKLLQVAASAEEFEYERGTTNFYYTSGGGSRALQDASKALVSEFNTITLLTSPPK